MTPMTPHPGYPPLAPPRREESIPRISDAPIYEALALGWVRAGRSLPGQHDREWAELAGQSPWPHPVRHRVPDAPGTAFRTGPVNPYTPPGPQW
jgi:hypothetical protein